MRWLVLVKRLEMLTIKQSTSLWISKSVVDKCIIDGQRVDTDWDNLYAYYKGVYPNIVDRLSEENGWRGEVISPSDSDDQVTDIDPKYVQ
jgi:hypothetical protein